jgi:hypothetical protein
VGFDHKIGAWMVSTEREILRLVCFSAQQFTSAGKRSVKQMP